jgi:hypothetical protein
MSRGDLRWFVLVCVSYVMGLVMACGGSDTCVESKCISGAWMHIPVAPATGLAGGTLSVCRNTECYTATLPPVPPADSAGASVFFAGTESVLATLWQQLDQTVVLDVEWHVGDSSQAAEGDHYVVTLTTAAGGAGTLLDKLATYHLTEPNPEECTPATICSITELVP